jgi:hypothetical protein
LQDDYQQLMRISGKGGIDEKSKYSYWPPSSPNHPDTDRDGWLDGGENAVGSEPLSQISTPINP